MAYSHFLSYIRAYIPSTSIYFFLHTEPGICRNQSYSDEIQYKVPVVLKEGFRILRRNHYRLETIDLQSDYWEWSITNDPENTTGFLSMAGIHFLWQSTPLVLLCWYSSINLAGSHHESSASVTDRCPKVQSAADNKTRVCLVWLVGQHIIKKNWTQISGSRHRFGSGQREAAEMDENNCSSEARVDRQRLSVPVVIQQMTRDTRSNYWLGFPLKYKGSGARTKEIKFHNSLSLAFEGLKNVRKSNAAHDYPLIQNHKWFR